MIARRAVAFVCGVIVLPLLMMGSHVLAAQSEVDKLRNQITEKNARLLEIEAEIAEYKASLNKVGAEKKTLQSAINQLDLERKKVQADISYTENKITSTDLEINKLSLEINETERTIARSEDAIRGILRNMNVYDNDSFIEIFLRSKNISEAWDQLESLEIVKESMRTQVKELSSLKSSLEGKRNLNSDRRAELVDLKSQYSDQSSVLANNKAEKSELLSATKNQEANYQAMLADKEAARAQLQKEVQDIESQLQFILDPNTIPTPGTPVFRWPIDPPIIITQNFGYTKFALSGAYGGSQHNGMDIGTPVGTKLYAPLTGTVRNVGNTDAVAGCYSWGKWILIDHPNGLSSMFAHLSQISVSPGQKVSTGDIVGYTGNTGYSTGPHLHYTLYVKAAVQVMQFSQFKSVTGCGSALSPFSAVEGYLNPRDFLPAP